MPFRPITAGSVTAPATGVLPAGSVASQLAELADGAATPITLFENIAVPDASPTTVATFDGSGRYLVIIGYDTDPTGPPTSTFSFTGSITAVVPAIAGSNTSGTGLWIYDVNGTANLQVTLTGGAADVTGFVALLKVADP